MTHSSQKNRIAIASALWSKFKAFYAKDSWKLPIKYLLNIPSIGITNKFITITTRETNSKKRKLTSTVNDEFWLNDDICYNLLRTINSSVNFVLQGAKFINKKDTTEFIELKTSIKVSISEQSQLFKNKLNEYKYLKGVENKKTYLGGLRKLLEQHRAAIDSLFNSKWIDKLIQEFNEWDMCHANINGEEKITKKGYVTKHKNEKILNLSEKQFEEKCDQLYSSVDLIYKLLEINKKI